MSADLYTTLNVARTADRAAIKRAFRRAAHRAHPDKGGSAEQFHAIRRAYSVLIDDKRRAEYDRTGEDGPVQDERAMLLNALAAMFLSAIDNLPESSDLVVAVRQRLHAAREGGVGTIALNDKAIAKRERVLQRLQRKAGGGDDFVRAVIEGDIAAKRRANEMHHLELARIDKLIAMSAEYSYQAGGFFGEPTPARIIGFQGGSGAETSWRWS